MTNFDQSHVEHTLTEFDILVLIKIYFKSQTLYKLTVDVTLKKKN